MHSIFREYDIRGIYEKELNETVTKLIGFFLGKEIKKYGNYVAIGYDVRSHSFILLNYLVSGLAKAGITTLNMGMVPTPVNYFANYNSFLVNDKEITPSGSIMITGSHNPSEYNGFKITINKMPFFGNDIYLMGDKIISLLEKGMQIPDKLDTIFIDAKNRYINYLSREFSFLKKLNIHIAYDCGNGVANIVMEDILKNIGIKSTALFCKPDGSFPNHHPDPSIQENLIDIKKELFKDADIAFAFDGDADRIAVLTKKNNIKGDILALLYSQNMKNPTVIGEVKCSQVMYDTIAARGGKAIMSKTGHSNLKVKLKQLNAALAVEVSGHIFFNDRYFGFDDAIYALLRTLELIFNGVDLDVQIANLPQMYSTQENKIETTESKKFLIIDKFKELLQNPPKDFPKIENIITIDGVRIIFNQGWGLVRASNTTPILVTRFESTNKDMVKIYKKHINGLINKAKESLQ